MKLRRFTPISAFIFIIAGLMVSGSLSPILTNAGEPALPIVYVHGGAGSAAQYETQAMRFASNGYPNVVTGIDRTSSSSPTLNPMLDAFFDAVMAQTGDRQIYVVAHSLGTSLMVNYLNSSPERWIEVPLPLDAKVSLPGSFFAASISSRTLLGGKEGAATSTLGTPATSETGAKSRTAS